MPDLSNWFIKAGTTPLVSFGQAKFKNVNLTTKPLAISTLTFQAPGTAFDADPLFPYKTPISVFDQNGKQVFVGLVTKIPLAGSPKSEDQSYVVSDLWWYFEKLVFQMEWMIDAMGDGTLIPTLRATTIVGNTTAGVKIDLGKMTTLVINYVLSTAQATGFVPFVLGDVTPSATIPFSDVAEQTCAQIIITMFAYVPDAQTVVDYSTTPPTLHIRQRPTLQPVTLQVGAKPLSSVNITPRDDLVVPAVIIKYRQTNTIDGQSLSSIVPDIFPLKAADPAFENIVVDVDLLPGSETFQKQNIVATDRPLDFNAAAGTGALSGVTINWLLGTTRAHWLRSYTIPAGSDPGAMGRNAPGNNTLNDITTLVDQSKLEVQSVMTTYVDNATTVDPVTGLIVPAPLQLPAGKVLPGAGPDSGGAGINLLDHLGQELLEGTVPPWLTNDQNIYQARVRIDIVVKYTGDDELVKTWFGSDGTLRFSYPATVTNASTDTYSKLASLTPSEPIPIGLAKDIYGGVSVKHYDGTIVLLEPECTGLVGLGNTLNLSNSRPEWATMNAQVIQVTWNIDRGMTTIRVGPPTILDANQLTALLRAARVRQQSFSQQEQQTGKTDTVAPTIQNGGASSSLGSALPPSMSPQPLDPWEIQWRHNGGAIEIKVNLKSTIYNPQGTPGNIAGTGLDSWFTCTPGAGDAVWIEGTVASLACTGWTIRSIGQGDSDFDTTGGTASWDASGRGDLVNDGATPPAQTLFRRLIARITADSRGNPVFFYELNTNLIIKNKFVSGPGGDGPCVSVEPYGS